MIHVSTSCQQDTLIGQFPAVLLAYTVCNFKEQDMGNIGPSAAYTAFRDSYACTSYEKKRTDPLQYPIWMEELEIKMYSQFDNRVVKY